MKLYDKSKNLEPLLGEVQEDFPYRLGRILYGWTHPIEEALRWACRDGHTETVKLILDFFQCFKIYNFGWKINFC